MGDAGARAAGNTAVRAIAEVAGKLASLVLFAALARAVGQSHLGVFVFAFAWVQIATTPIALGVDRYLLRQVARDRSRTDELVNVLALKLALALPIVALSFAALALLGYGGEARAAVYVLTPGLLMDSLARTLYSVFNAHERGDLLSLCLVVQRIGAAALGLGVLAAGYGVVAVAGTYTAGTALGLALAAVLLRRSIRVRVGGVTARAWRSLTAASLPFAAQDVFGVLLARLDAVLLSLIAVEAAVGRYGAAYRLFEATFFIASSIHGAVAAMYTYLTRDSEPAIHTVFERSIKAALVALVPCAVAFGVLAEPAARAFFGDELAGAADPLRLLAPAVVLMGMVYLGSSLVVSRAGARRMVGVTAGLVALNVALNLALIPAYEDAGAAAAMLLTLAVGAVVVLRLASTAVGGGVSWWSVLFAPVGAGLAMASVTAAAPVGPAPALVAGVAVYGAVLVLLEWLTAPSELAVVRGLVRRRLFAGGAE